MPLGLSGHTWVIHVQHSQAFLKARRGASKLLCYVTKAKLTQVLTSQKSETQMFLTQLDYIHYINVLGYLSAYPTLSHMNVLLVPHLVC